jgi:hypothetical protein
MANGVMHHLNDREAVDLFKLAFAGLKKGGRMLTIDGCYTKNQHRLIRFILSKDRGKFVRNREEYVNLASKVFSGVKTELRDDMLNIPYNHLIIECTK